VSELCQKYSFNIIAVMGSGFGSTVYLGTRNKTSEMVCIKAVDLLSLGFATPYTQMIHQEIQCLGMFDSDFIVRLYDVYHSGSFCYLVMELCAGGDLYKMLKLSPGDLPEGFISTIIGQIA
jgi:serine/threonine protein kinase